jgi:uncharacterized protein YndB with AHSA1/START domain
MKLLSKPGVEKKEREVVLTSHIDAPRELVFRAWTNPEQVKKWWGPGGFSIPVCEIDLRKGGSYRIVMHGQGKEYPMKGIYLDIAENEKLTFTVNVEEHPQEWKHLLNENLGFKANDSSLESVIDASFKDEDGKTKLTIITHFGTDSVRDAYLKIKMVEGWTESLERLQELLSKD